MDRRTFIVSAAAMTAAPGAWHPAGAAQGRSVTVTGPITGGKHGRPLGAYPRDLARLGYVEEEYFISGEAGSYAVKGEMTRDGKWTAAATGQTQPYTTRILVHKPKDPARFNGTVIVEWINVTPGNDNILIADDPMYEGFAVVLVSAQAVGVHGFPTAKPDMNFGLTSWDAERYKTLKHPGDAYSFDIYHQIGRLLKTSNASNHPLRGLQVRKLIATGASQSAGRLRGYINGVHPIDQVYDAYIPFLDFGRATSLNAPANTGAPAPGAAGAPAPRPGTRIREDLDVPTVVVITEQEAVFYRGDNAFTMQPDTDRFRHWEVAGAPHSPDIPTIRRAIGARDGFRRAVSDSGPTAAAPTVPGAHVTSWHCTIAALYHTHNWITGGAAPPHSPRLRFTEGTKIIRDSLELGTGGIRLPEVEVPIEMNTGLPEDPKNRSNAGESRPFPPELTAKLYPSHQDYVDRVTAAAQAAHSAGFIRPYRVQEYITAAKAQKLPGVGGATG